MKKIDITSTVVEKGIDAAKDFLSKLISPAIEETGLLLKDKIAFWRFKNQVKMINKANEFCVKNNIKNKQISMKMLNPILEYAALEESEILQDKWAIMLSNMVDSEQNIENHVFPHILSQLSKKEFEVIEISVNQKIKERIRLKEELRLYKHETDQEKETLEKRINELKIQFQEYQVSVTDSIINRAQLRSEISKYESILRNINFKYDRIKREIELNPILMESELENFEISNLVRLGLTKAITRQYAYISDSHLSFDPQNETVNLEGLSIEIEPDYDDYIITQLGEIFIDVCTEKRKKST